MPLTLHQIHHELLLQPAQSKEAEEARQQAEARVQELAYSNKKLAGELDGLHEAARASAERDRRALKGLREGLAAVEAAVAARSQKGATQVRCSELTRYSPAAGGRGQCSDRPWSRRCRVPAVQFVTQLPAGHLLHVDGITLTCRPARL
jgi:hypothetical protein